MIGKWRVKQVNHDGYYNVYTVEKRLLFFWEPIRTFNTLAEAVEYIKRQKVKPVLSIVHKE